MELIATSSVSLLDLINLTHDVASLNAVYLGISVSAVLVLTGIIFGVFYFFNLKPLQEKITKQEEKIDIQKKETGQVLKSSEDKLAESLKNFGYEYEKHIDELLTSNDEKNNLKTTNKIAAVEKTFLERIEAILEDKNIKLKEIVLSEVMNKISTAEKSINVELNKLQTDFNDKTSSIRTKISSLEEKTFNLRKSLVDFEIEHHLKKGQVGAMRKMIEKLEMNIEQGWGEENTILEIKDYIAEKGMPNYYFNDLNKVIEKMPKKLDAINEEVRKLAQEKLFSPK